MKSSLQPSQQSNHQSMLYPVHSSSDADDHISKRKRGRRIMNEVAIPIQSTVPPGTGEKREATASFTDASHNKKRRESSRTMQDSKTIRAEASKKLGNVKEEDLGGSRSTAAVSNLTRAVPTSAASSSKPHAKAEKIGDPKQTSRKPPNIKGKQKVSQAYQEYRPGR